jgi:hypothetical protein
MRSRIESMPTISSPLGRLVGLHRLRVRRHQVGDAGSLGCASGHGPQNIALGDYAHEALALGHEGGTDVARHHPLRHLLQRILGGDRQEGPRHDLAGDRHAVTLRDPACTRSREPAERPPGGWPGGRLYRETTRAMVRSG